MSHCWINLLASPYPNWYSCKFVNYVRSDTYGDSQGASHSQRTFIKYMFPSILLMHDWCRLHWFRHSLRPYPGSEPIRAFPLRPEYHSILYDEGRFTNPAVLPNAIRETLANGAKFTCSCTYHLHARYPCPYFMDNYCHCIHLVVELAALNILATIKPVMSAMTLITNGVPLSGIPG